MTHDPVPGLQGTLFSPRAATLWLDAQPGADEAAVIAGWASDAAEELGPASSPRRLLEKLEDLFLALGFTCRQHGEGAVAISGTRAAALSVFAWSRPMPLGSRAAQRAAMEVSAGWCVAFNGTGLALGDARDGMPRRTATISLEDLASHARASRFVAALLGAQAFAADAPAAAVRASDESSREVRHALRDGVHASVLSLSASLPFDTALAVLFRLLFVLFAEARALVPVWHRVYRDHYSLASLALERDARGTWAGLEARRRLLGRGGRAGTLHVHGFNGPLFAGSGPHRWAASARLESRLDAPAARALGSLVEYRAARGGARRVSYAELDVEELGTIYERVLDIDPAGHGRIRKESGSFYTPRALTEFVARRALAPLAAGASSDQILSLRIVDPAMGSGAFLIAALRYLAAQLERALVREGRLPEHDVTEADRQQLRRSIAQHCLYGVDANPTAVTLARLSIWLATLSSAKPLGFLDQHLRCGNSLVGIDAGRAAAPPGVARRDTALPLFDDEDAAAALRRAAVRAAAVASMNEDSVDAVKRKQRAHSALTSSRGPAAPLRTLCDLWCATWFAPRERRPDAREYRALADAVLHRRGVMPARALRVRLEAAAAVARREAVFHWPLEFPEVFEGGGFDAVIGNPPWEMIRAGRGSDARAPLNEFVRRSGVYPLAASGHVNLYQLFLERSLQIVKPEGRIGMVMPWGLFTDDGSTALRKALFDGAGIDTLARLDNRDGTFQAHRGIRFAAVTATAGAPQDGFELTRAGSVQSLDDVADTGRPGRGPEISRSALMRLSGPSQRVPDVADAAALAEALRIARHCRGLGDREGWGAVFSRELNLTDDRALFSSRGLPVLEGKHVGPHRVDLGKVRHHISRAAAVRQLPSRPFDRPRLAYRDVTAATNRQTLIAAIIPAGAVTSHSLFCLQNEWDLQTQNALCAILNSPTANALMRLFVGSHVTTSLMAWLPVPPREDAVAALARVPPASRRADAIVARLYGVV